MSRYNLIDKIDETSCCDRLFGNVVVIGYLYRFGASLKTMAEKVRKKNHSNITLQEEKIFGAWLIHLFMV
jgi:hypothetical protein